MTLLIPGGRGGVKVRGHVLPRGLSGSAATEGDGSEENP